MVALKAQGRRIRMKPNEPGEYTATRRRDSVQTLDGSSEMGATCAGRSSPS